MGLLSKIFGNHYSFKNLYIKYISMEPYPFEIAICHKVDNTYVHVSKNVTYPAPSKDSQQLDEYDTFHPIVPWLQEYFQNFSDVTESHYLSRKTLIAIESDINECFANLNAEEQHQV